MASSSVGAGAGAGRAGAGGGAGSGGGMSRGNQRLIAKLDEAIKEGEFYSALQMLKAGFARQRTRKFEDAVQLLVDGTLSLTKNHKNAAALDCGTLLCQTFKENRTPLVDHIDSVKRINDSFEPGSEHAAFMKQAVAWATAVAPPHGTPELNRLAAAACTTAGDYASAARYHLHSDAPEEFADTLYQWSSTGVKSERDLFLARAVLQMLAEGNLGGANSLRDKFLSRLPAAEWPATPLMNFIQFLLLTLERDAAPLFQLLCQKYQQALDRDPSLSLYLQRIGRVFYNIQPPKSMMDTVMSLLSGSGPGAGRSGITG